MSEIFISYARSTNNDNALALKQRLGPIAFLDTQGIAPGERFSNLLVESILNAKIMIILADDAYFTREFCLWEYQIAQETVRLSGSTQNIIVAIPDHGASTSLMVSLLPFRDINLPKASETEVIATTAINRIQHIAGTIGDTLGPARTTYRDLMIAAAEIPPEEPITAAHNRLPLRREPPFVGRKFDLNRIHAAFATTAPRSARVVWLKAPGGYGKTRLAQEYVLRVGRAHYPDGVFWIDAREDIDGQFEEILDILKPDRRTRTNTQLENDSITTELRSTLQAHQGRILFVVDNVPDYETPRTIETWCPAPEAVDILATSRRTSRAEDAAILLILEPLPTKAAVTLLRNKVPQPNLLAEEGWQRIAIWVGELPLALELLNKVLQYGTLTPPELHAAVGREGPATVVNKQRDAIAAEEPSLSGATQAYLLSYQHLSSSARQAIHCLAELSPAPIPSTFIHAFGSEILSQAALNELVARSFLTDAGRAGPIPMIGSVHRVIADFVRQLSPDRPRTIILARDAALRILDRKTWPIAETWQTFFESCLPHVEFIHDSLFRRLEEGGEYSDAQVLEQRVGQILFERGIFDVWSDKPNDLEDLNARLEKYNPFNMLIKATIASVMLERYGNLGADLHDVIFDQLPNLPVSEQQWAAFDGALGQLDWAESRDKAQKAVAWRTKRLGKANPNTIKAMYDLGLFLWLLREPVASVMLFDEILTITAEAVGPRHANTTVAAWSVFNMGLFARMLTNDNALIERIYLAHVDYLGWLHEVDESTLAPIQRTIRNQLRNDEFRQ